MADPDEVDALIEQAQLAQQLKVATASGRGLRSAAAGATVGSGSGSGSGSGKARSEQDEVDELLAQAADEVRLQGVHEDVRKHDDAALLQRLAALQGKKVEQMAVTLDKPVIPDNDLSDGDDDETVLAKVLAMPDVPADEDDAVGRGKKNSTRRRSRNNKNSNNNNNNKNSNNSSYNQKR